MMVDEIVCCYGLDGEKMRWGSDGRLDFWGDGMRD